MRMNKLFIGLSVIPFLLTACSKAGNAYYKEATKDLENRVVELLKYKSEHSSVYAPKEYTLEKFTVNFSDGYMIDAKWACVINYSYEANKLDVTTEVSEKEETTAFVFYSRMEGELVFDDDKVENYNLIKDTKGSKHIVYEAQKY